MMYIFCIFFFNAPAPTEIYTLSLHDALPILRPARDEPQQRADVEQQDHDEDPDALRQVPHPGDRKSTRLNSSHVEISYAVFCLKKKKINNKHIYYYTIQSVRLPL